MKKHFIFIEIFFMIVKIIFQFIPTIKVQEDSILSFNYGKSEEIKVRQEDYSTQNDLCQFKPTKTIIMKKIVHEGLDVPMSGTNFSFELRLANENNCAESFKSGKLLNSKFKEYEFFILDLLFSNLKKFMIKKNISTFQNLKLKLN